MRGKPRPIPRHHSKRWHDRKNRGRRHKTDGSYRSGLIALAVVGILAAAGSAHSYGLFLPSLLPASTGLGCNIKGNISASGERIFHVPGQRYYQATRISAARGERWFCSEAEARNAGWRRARV
jgi:hypothetical protein